MYIVTYLNDKTGWIHIGFLNKKSQQLKDFKAYEVVFECQHEIKVRCLRIDRGGEYASRKAPKYLKEQGITWKRSASRTPQQNGHAERLNKTIIEMARCLMIDAGLGLKFRQIAATRMDADLGGNKGWGF